MAAMDYSKLEACILMMDQALEKAHAGVVDVAPTYASGNYDEYFRYIAFTQRVLKDGKIVCYITYRLTKTRSTTPPALSSFEVFKPDYNRATSTKFKLSAYASPKEAFTKTYNYVCELIEGR